MSIWDVFVGWEKVTTADGVDKLAAKTKWVISKFYDAWCMMHDGGWWRWWWRYRLWRYDEGLWWWSWWHWVLIVLMWIWIRLLRYELVGCICEVGESIFLPSLQLLSAISTILALPYHKPSEQRYFDNQQTSSTTSSFLRQKSKSKMLYSFDVIPYM